MEIEFETKHLIAGPLQYKEFKLALEDPVAFEKKYNVKYDSDGRTGGLHEMFKMWCCMV